jgi:hypothetical protein
MRTATEFWDNIDKNAKRTPSPKLTGAALVGNAGNAPPTIPIIV